MSDFTRLPDLAAKRLGGMVLAASDEFFAPKENLLEPAAPAWIADRYTDRGKWMDGWESRRRRGPGYDWCIVRLGLPGIVRGLVVDTSHFTGNHPEACWVEGCDLDDGIDATEPSVPWTGILGRTALEGNAVQHFPVENPYRVTHLRFGIHPDGGVARLRVHGEVVPDPDRLAGEIDLAAIDNGGLVVDASGEFFSSSHNLIMVGRSEHMGDGWETRRRRGPGHDWATVQLAARGVIRRAEVDTSHYKGNYPDACSLDIRDGDQQWREILPRTPLQPHWRHIWDLAHTGPATSARLQIHPDGGVARLRLWGEVDPAGMQRLRLRWLNALLRERAEAELLRCCGSTRWARRMAARRPFSGLPQILAAADEDWRGLSPQDWLEAFAAHPRIGERKAAAPSWAMQEQAATATAAEDTMTALREANAAYEARFGYLFIVCATGKGAEQMLEILRGRLGNLPDAELEIAAEEQRKITALRLDKLLAGA